LLRLACMDCMADELGGLLVCEARRSPTSKRWYAPVAISRALVAVPRPTRRRRSGTLPRRDRTTRPASRRQGARTKRDSRTRSLSQRGGTRRWPACGRARRRPLVSTRSCSKHPPARFNFQGRTAQWGLHLESREWGVIPYLPCTIKLLKVSVGTVEFYEQPDYERLVAAARELDPRIELLVLLGGDAGLRRGEIIALEQSDCDTRRASSTCAGRSGRGTSRCRRAAASARST
jgi:integrase